MLLQWRYLGWYGLAAAKTYIEVNPSAKLVVLEAGASAGGVWSRERLYPGLKSNNMLGTYEYSDFPMDPATFGVQPGQHIPGTVIHAYLTQYAQHFDVYRRIRFKSMVESAEHQDGGGWILTYRTPATTATSSPPRDGAAEHAAPTTTRLFTQKLILATGLCSDPFLPSIRGSETFAAPFFHCKELPERQPVLIKEATSVALLGGTKFAWDAAYAFASAGVKVDWIIRKSGTGPAWVAPPYVTPLKKWLEKLVTTRALTWFSPCSWGEADGFASVRRYLHGTKMGRWIVDRFWRTLADDVVQLNGYDTHPETQKLKPWREPFWIATSLSILNYPTNIFDLVRSGAIKIHVDDIDHLSSRTVHLSSGKALAADALLCSTGWKHRPPMKFLPEGIETALGLPTRSDGPEQELALKADAEILKRFPRLASQPAADAEYKPLEGKDAPTQLNRPFRLYRFMVPPAFIEERSIAYTGMVINTIGAITAQTQALWVTSYFNGTLPLDQLDNDKAPNDDDDDAATSSSLRDRVQWDTVLHSQFGVWRYPGGLGRRFPDFVFDALPYLDRLLRDLGLPFRRKHSFMAECLEPYGPADYRGLVDEWRIKNKA